MTDTPARPWPKAILFDLDDTLWPIGPVIVQAETSLHAWLAANAPRVAAQFSIDVLRQHRLELLASEPQYHLDLGELRRAGLLRAFALAGEDLAKVEAAMRHFFAARNAVVLYDDVLPGLLQLKETTLATISNGNADLRAIGLAHHFKVSVSARELGCAKPDAAIFHAACTALGVAPRDALYVGDDLLLDVQGAQRAGLRAVWLRRGTSGAPGEQGVVPDAICANFHELLDWLRREHQA